MKPGEIIYLLEMDQGEWVWCDDAYPDNCNDRTVIKYKRVEELQSPEAENQ